MALWAATMAVLLRPVRQEAQRQAETAEVRPCVYVRTITEERAMRRAACRHLGAAEVARIERMVDG